MYNSDLYFHVVNRKTNMTDTINKNSTSNIRVFTQLCKNANISLFGKTMTIYPKWQGVTVKNHDSHVAEAIKPIDDAWKKLGDKNAIREFDPRHENFHQDDLSRDDWHTHIEFEEELDENKLTQILNEFVSSRLISSKEQQQFINAYRQANQLSQEDFDKFIVNSYLLELNISINKKYANRDNKELMLQAKTVVDQFEHLINAGNDLRKVQKYIKETLLVIENPTKANVRRLYDMGMKAQGAPSLLWKALGVSLMLLGAVMFTAGIIIATGTSGLGMAPGIGITLGGFGLFAGGVAIFHHGLHKGLSKNLTKLSNSIEDSLSEDENAKITV